MKTTERQLKLTASIAGLCLAAFLNCSAGDLAADNLTVETNAIVKGNVGIGNTNPAARLHVSGDAVFTGNVGVGTTSPVNKLDVAGNANITGTLTSGAITSSGSITGTGINGTSASINNGGSGFATLVFSGGYGGIFQNAAESFTIDQQAAAPIFFRTDGGVYRLTILNSSGNVGIGTNAPSERIHVVGNVKATGQFIGNGSGLLISAQGDLSMGTFIAGQQP